MPLCLPINNNLPDIYEIESGSFFDRVGGDVYCAA